VTADLLTHPALVLVAALLVADLGVRLSRHYALRRGVFDVPNERSSHSVPTPRGGGIGVVAAVLLVGGATLARVGVLPAALVLGGFAVASVAVIGWLDDHRPLAVRWRLVVHLAAAGAVAALASRGASPSVLGAAAGLWWLFCTVSAINVVNFMDGIDGLIGSQLALFGGYALLMAPTGSPTALLAAAVLGASLGFVRWNWSPARIFLGDVGSGAYGVIAVLLLLGLTTFDRRLAFGRAALPLVPLALDAATTLARRAIAGERLTTAHRRHLYQRLANGGWGQARTSLVSLLAGLVGGIAGALAPAGPGEHLVTACFVAGTLIVGSRLDRRVPWPAK
jgi:Fuc2NAc and GlcNAc transferase